MPRPRATTTPDPAPDDGSVRTEPLTDAADALAAELRAIADPGVRAVVALRVAGAAGDAQSVFLAIRREAAGELRRGGDGYAPMSFASVGALLGISGPRARKLIEGQDDKGAETEAAEQ